jgi:hypothetical protein
MYHKDKKDKIDQDELDKARYSFYSAVLFFILASPPVYKLVDQLLGSIVRIADPAGCATTVGLFVHAIVFGLIIFGLMHLKI